jgi:1-acyl-sn-glycerol-3-phosphate acyltransferase
MTAPVQRSLANRTWQAFLKFSCRLGAIGFFNIRCGCREKVPKTGGGLMLSNHQSNLDPVLVGLASDRRLNYVARKTLFKFPPFRWLINSLDAISIDREGTGLDGLKETLRRLKRGEIVLLFPEGTRTPDGEVQAMKPGFCAVARRSAVPILPVALDGAWHSWPRQQKLPRRAVIHVQFGDPIEPAEINQLTDEQLVSEVERRIRACHERARAGRLRASGRG